MPHVELPQAEFKAVMLGDTNAGKTSLVIRFAEGYYRNEGRSSTIGAFFITKRVQAANGVTCKIQIWDTAGQPQFRPMAPMYYKNAAAAIVCYDVTDANSYRIMTEWLDELHRNIPAGTMVIAIAATKCDKIRKPAKTSEKKETESTEDVDKNMPLPSCDENEQPSHSQPAIPLHEAERLAQTLGAIFVKTSAKDNEGVDDLYKRVAERVLRYRKQSESGIQGPIPVTPGAVAKDLKRSGSARRSFGGESSLTNSPFMGSTRKLYEDMSTTGLGPVPLPILGGPAPSGLYPQPKIPPSYNNVTTRNIISSSEDPGAFTFNGFSGDERSNVEGSLSADPTYTESRDRSHSFGNYSHHSYRQLDSRYTSDGNTKRDQNFCAASPFMCDVFSNSTADDIPSHRRQGSSSTKVQFCTIC